MSLSWARASAALVDNAGNIAKVVFNVAIAGLDPATGPVLAVVQAIAEVISGYVYRSETGTQDAATPGTIGVSDYSAVEDRMTLTYVGESGSTGTFEVPGPLSTCFHAGTDTVNLSDSHVADLATALQSVACDPYGGAITVIKGIRTRKKQMKK